MPRSNTPLATKVPFVIAALGVAALGAAIWLSVDKEIGSHGAASGTGAPSVQSLPAQSQPTPPSDTGTASTVAMEQPLTAQQSSVPEPTVDELHAIADMFALDPYGQLALDDKLIAAFEVLRAEFGATEPAGQLQRAQDALRRALPGAAGERAGALFQTYLGYRQDLDRLMAEAMAAQDEAIAPERLFERMHALRRQHFDADTADALFGMEEAQARYSLEAARIEQDSSLTPAQRQERLEALRKQLPPDTPALVLEEARVDDLAAQVATLRERGAAEADVQYLREQRLGIDAAREFAKMEAQQDEWNRRYQLYRQERLQIDAAALSPEDKEAEIEQLRRKHFHEQELAAVQAHDREAAR